MERILFSNDYYFTKEALDIQRPDFSILEQINLPHTWNNQDGQDGGNDYYRGTCFYVKKFNKPQCENKQVYLEFNGVAMSSDVYLNGKYLYQHKGGYQRFNVNITDTLQDENILVISVDNGKNDSVYPQRADFTFYGGIYRDVYLLVVPNIHFDIEYYGSSGVKVTPILNDDLSTATVKIEAYLNGESDVCFKTNSETKTVRTDNRVATTEFAIDNPHLWNGLKDPYLYDLTVSIDDMEVNCRYGIREFHMDPNKGFFLNKKQYRLLGVSKHQDRWAVGNAISKADLDEDVDIIREMGANTIRLAHYQHDQYLYDLCDKYGLIVWAEIPYITQHLTNGNENTRSQLKELIIQNYNHPCIVCWGLSNEITTSSKDINVLYDNHVELNAIAHKLDQTRPTTMAHMFMLKPKEKLVRLADICSYNLYYGWYVGNLEQNEKFLDDYHKKYPKSVIGLSEYGADANPQFQSIKPVKGDYTESYQCLYHEHMLKLWETREYIWAQHVWNMFDFAADGRNEGGKPGQNQKGLVTFDRKIRKDPFYLYKAYLSDEPFVHLCGKRYINRHEDISEIKVYTNQRHILLYVDDQLVGEKDGDKVFTFNITISKTHKITVKSHELSDEMMINKVNEQDPSYESEVMKIKNWFDVDFNSNCYSLKDSAAKVKKNPEAKKVLDNYYYPMINGMLSKYGDVSEGVVKIPNIVYKIMDLIPMKTLFNFITSMISLDNVEALATELQKIKK